MCFKFSTEMYVLVRTSMRRECLHLIMLYTGSFIRQSSSKHTGKRVPDESVICGARMQGSFSRRWPIVTSIVNYTYKYALLMTIQKIVDLETFVADINTKFYPQISCIAGFAFLKIKLHQKGSFFCWQLKHMLWQQFVDFVPF